MKSTNPALLKRLPLVMAVVAMSATHVPADTIAPDIESFTLYAKHNVTIGGRSVVRGRLGAGNDVSAGANVRLDDILVDDDIWLGTSAVVRGMVLANDKAEADSQLDFQGSGWAGKSVCLGQDASVTGRLAANTDGIAVSSRAQVVGDITSNHNVYIAGDSAVHGGVSPGLGKHLIVGDNVTITGTVVSGHSPFDVFDAPGVPKKPHKDSCGKLNVSQGNNATTTLAPGAYKDVNMWGAETTLNLEAGTYTMHEFWIASGGTVNVDTTDGDVILNAHKDFDTGSDVTFNVTGPGSLEINLFDNDVWLGHDTTIEADIRVWDGKFGAGDNFSLVGTVWADKDIDLGSGSTVASSSAVPEPSSLLLLTCGAALAVRRKRHAARRRR